MSYRLVPNSVTLDHLEWRNSCNRRVISPNSQFGSFWGGLRKVVEDTPILSAAKIRPKNLVFGDIITPSESVEVRHSALASENLTNNQPELGNAVR